MCETKIFHMNKNIFTLILTMCVTLAMVIDLKSLT